MPEGTAWPQGRARSLAACTTGASPAGHEPSSHLERSPAWQSAALLWHGLRSLPPMGLAILRARPPGLPGPEAPERHIPQQGDYAARLARATVTVVGSPPAGSRVMRRQETLNHRALLPDSHAAWLMAAPFRLVMGAGLLGMYEHFGRIKALDSLGIVPRDMVGISSGAITGALVGTLPLHAVEEELLRLSILDMIDPSLSTAWRGSMCAGDGVERALDHMLLRSGQSRLEDTQPRLQIAVYSLQRRRTELLSTGPLAQAARRSAALPVLFAPDSGYIDGGWMDDQGRLWMPPGERALQSRLPTGHDHEDENSFTRRLGRTDPRRGIAPVYSLSEDPQHLTALIELQGRFKPPAFIFELDFNRAKQRRLIDASEVGMMRWLLAPVRR